jgi:hypothetical protein
VVVVALPVIEGLIWGKLGGRLRPRRTSGVVALMVSVVVVASSAIAGWRRVILRGVVAGLVTLALASWLGANLTALPFSALTVFSEETVVDRVLVEVALVEVALVEVALVDGVLVEAAVRRVERRETLVGAPIVLVVVLMLDS